MVLTMASLETSQARTVAAPKPCLTMGKPILVAGKAVATCTAFYKTGSAIHIERDTKTTRYGLAIVSLSQPPTATLTNRSGVQTPLAVKFVPAVLHGKKELSQYLFRATLRNGKIMSAKPVLYVPVGTMVKPFGSTQFIGTVNNLKPDDGIDSSAWMRWNFSKLNAQQKMQGRFVNLNSAVRINPILEPPAPCQAPLNNGPALTAWYSQVLGTAESLSLYWDPGMHMPMDSELVVVMGSGLSYMTSTPSINVLMRKNLDIAREYSFTIHGNPMGTPYQFTGNFSPVMPTRACTLD